LARRWVDQVDRRHRPPQRANGYSGSTTVNAGVLLATATGALPGWNVSGQVVGNGGAVGGYIGARWTEGNFATLRDSAAWAATGGRLHRHQQR